MSYLLGFKELIIHGAVKYKEYLHYDFIQSAVRLMYSGKDDPPQHLHPENNPIVTLKVYALSYTLVLCINACQRKTRQVR